MSQTLQQTASQIRRGIVSSIGAAASGHPGGSLSSVEILTALYFRMMRVRPDDPTWEERDRFVLCKGHAAPVLYATLAARGFFPEEELLTLRKLGSRLQGHPDMRKLPGVDLSTGSLGQGLSAALGMALSLRLQNNPGNVYALLGDGELQEGQVWEAAMAAGHYAASKLTAIVDFNGLQIDGPIASVLNPLPLSDKWRSFGWRVIPVDGHSLPSLLTALASARDESERPTLVVARTVKGKGVSFMENRAEWHGSAPNAEQVAAALEELKDEDREALGHESQISTKGGEGDDCSA